MSAPSQAEIHDGLTRIYRDVFAREDLELRPEMAGKDIEGWDSFKQVEIILAIEERYRILMTAREIDALRNVGDFERLISVKVAVKTNWAGAAESIS